MNLFQKLAIVISLLSVLFLSGGAFSNSSADTAWQFCAAGDLTSIAIRDAMKAYKCEVDVLLGDYYGKEGTFVGGFKETPAVPILAACGNHDDCDEVIKEDNIITQDRTTFGFKWKNVGFLILNSEESIKSQKTEAVRLLDKWKANPDIDHVVIALHKCVICNQSAHHTESELKDYRSQVTTWATTYPKINTLLQGHNHGYQECEPETPDIHVITEGTGGRTPYPWGSKTDDGCHGYISGSKYNGYSIATVTPEDIEIHHTSVK